MPQLPMKTAPGHSRLGGEEPHQCLQLGGCGEPPRPQRLARGLRGREGGGDQGPVAIEDGPGPDLGDLVIQKYPIKMV